MLKDKTICQFLNIKVEKDKSFTITHNGKDVYYESSSGQWWRYEYDLNGNEIYYEDSDGFWVKREYDSEGRQIYYVNSKGYWWKQERDSEGNVTYFEDSSGHILDNRPKELTLDEIAEKFGFPVEQLKIKK